MTSVLSGRRENSVVNAKIQAMHLCFLFSSTMGSYSLILEDRIRLDSASRYWVLVADAPVPRRCLMFSAIPLWTQTQTTLSLTSSKVFFRSFPFLFYSCFFLDKEPGRDVGRNRNWISSQPWMSESRRVSLQPFSKWWLDPLAGPHTTSGTRNSRIPERRPKRRMRFRGFTTRAL